MKPALILALALVGAVAGCEPRSERVEIPRDPGFVTYSKARVALDGDTLWVTVVYSSLGGVKVYALNDSLRVFTDDEMWGARVLR